MSTHLVKKEKNHSTFLRLRRKRRVRAKISGTEERPRLSVFRSAQHIYLQVINDLTGHTLVSISSYEKGATKVRANKDNCLELGKKLAARCKEKNIDKIVFDKNGNRYHGRIKAVADGAREAGLIF